MTWLYSSWSLDSSLTRLVNRQKWQRDQRRTFHPDSGLGGRIQPPPRENPDQSIPVQHQLIRIRIKGAKTFGWQNKNRVPGTPLPGGSSIPIPRSPGILLRGQPVPWLPDMPWSPPPNNQSYSDISILHHLGTPLQHQHVSWYLDALLPQTSKSSFLSLL